MSFGLSLTLAMLISSTPCLDRAPSLSSLAQGLERYVNDQGEVDYQGIAKDKSTLFASFLDEATSLCPTTYQALTLDERIALLLNLYNAWVIEFMAGSDGKPDSILKVRVKGKSVFDAPIIRVTWHPESLTLNQIEKRLLPALRKDPRYHFALVCGAKSCPKLRRKPYMGSELSDTLSLETLKFLKDPERNQLAGNVWRISRLFDWYKTEFGTSESARIDWLLEQLGTKTKRPERLEFLEYDWTPNQRK